MYVRFGKCAGTITIIAADFVNNSSVTIVIGSAFRFVKD